eukprot:SAG31_NODE_3844_length_3822_cov_1.533978_3_plen_279_part_00
MAAIYRSKLGGEFPADFIQRMDKQHHAEIKRIRSLPENRQCAECQAEPTTWASVSLGVFVCMRCSQVHRNLGAHISKVKSCMGTYLWCPDELERMRQIGNARAAALYTHSKPAGMAKPAADCSFEEVDAFARAKYEAKRWVHPGGLQAAIASAKTEIAAETTSPARQAPALSRQVAANKRAEARAKARAIRAASKCSTTSSASDAANSWEAAWEDESAEFSSAGISAAPTRKPSVVTAGQSIGSTDLIDLFADWNPPPASCQKQASGAATADLLALFA